MECKWQEPWIHSFIWKNKCVKFNLRHDGPIWKIRWADLRHDFLLATAGFDGKIKLWVKDSSEKENYKLVYKCGVLKSSINALDFAPYNKGLVLAAGAANGNLILIKYPLR